MYIAGSHGQHGHLSFHFDAAVYLLSIKMFKTVQFMLVFNDVTQRAPSLLISRQLLWGDGSASSSRYILQVYGLYTTSKQIHGPALFCPFLPLTVSLLRLTWLHAAGYLKISNACEALTISGNCCWVISGKKVSLQFPLPPQRASTHAHTHAHKHACMHTRIHKDLLSSTLLLTRMRRNIHREFRGAVFVFVLLFVRRCNVWLIGQENGHGDKTQQDT